MTRRSDTAHFTRERFCHEAAHLLALIRHCPNIRSARDRLYRHVSQLQFTSSLETRPPHYEERVVVRDCARAWRGILQKRSDQRAGFSVMAALWDIAHGQPRPELGPGFYAELIHLVQGIEGRARYTTPDDVEIDGRLTGREAARQRSRSLDRLWHKVTAAMGRYEDGLGAEALARRAERRAHIMHALDANSRDWADWRWQVRHVVKQPDLLARLVALREDEIASVRAAVEARLPFGVTPYYLSLMDDDPEAGRDLTVRAQVLPPADYVREMSARRGNRRQAFDFMLEHDTSPIDLITRRYPAIAILKPFNTCPQICVYCQRNWEIHEAMSPGALAPSRKLEAACQWIEDHPAIRELLITGGDPLTLGDARLQRLFDRVARIDHLDLIRIGTRLPVTVPMRITGRLAKMLGALREPGRREVCVVTHVEHPYEVTPDFVTAIERLRSHGIAVYNQHVYTFYVSRRFEAAALRMLLRRCGVDPYYTFAPKGKHETDAYRVPLARLLQEQKEEARLLPGLRRSDEAVYNVPGLGKNNLRAFQHRDLISILPDGARVYEFHPWEKRVLRRAPYVGTDV
ncbi:MAG: KamA family radical SAM protein, partial [Deltaproteobacteria bacterium]|nr:KamA family radical SAM protein [Deltaproteobacteria bacterium]